MHKFFTRSTSCALQDALAQVRPLITAAEVNAWLRSLPPVDTE